MLLEIPSTFRRPDPKGAGEEIEIACDWLEASALFSGESVTSPDVTDLLVEGLWFKAQPDAREFVDLVLSRMKARRIAAGSSGPFTFGYQSIEPKTKNWKDSPAYAFCLLLSYARHNPEWAGQKKVKWNYNTQGEIFERMSCNSLEQLLPTWTVYSTGWSATKTAQLGKVVEEISRRLCGEVHNLRRWNKQQAKEAGLDVLCYRRFEDGRGNFPAFFVQCASGRKFEQKLKDPHLGVWTDLVSLVPSSLPRKGFVTPFVFPQRQFERYAIQSEGLLLDRCRLLSAEARKPDWLDEKTANQIRKWGKPFVKTLPWPK